MYDMGYFIDIERFVSWTYKNVSFLDNEMHVSKNTLIKWRKYESTPRLNILNEINKHVSDKFKVINIADFLICVNNAKDHNRGNKNRLESVNSTGKKILNLLLLGKILDGNKNNNGFFTVSKNTDLFNYLNTCYNTEKSIENFYYLPGRAVSVKQLQNVGENYNNGINSSAIFDGLKELERVGIVKRVDVENGYSIKKPEQILYKLDFEGCLNFLVNNKKLDNERVHF